MVFIAITTIVNTAGVAEDPKKWGVQKLHIG